MKKYIYVTLTIVGGCLLISSIFLGIQNSSIHFKLAYTLEIIGFVLLLISLILMFSIALRDIENTKSKIKRIANDVKICSTSDGHSIQVEISEKESFEELAKALSGYFDMSKMLTFNTYDRHADFPAKSTRIVLDLRKIIYTLLLKSSFDIKKPNDFK